MTYIDRIRNNVNDAIEIKKLAVSKQIDYKTAKIKYFIKKYKFDEKKEEEIVKTIKEEKVPLKIIEKYNIINKYRTFSFEKLFMEIYEYSKTYTNMDDIDLLDDSLSSKFYYGNFIYLLLEKGYSLERAIKKFDEDVIDEMKKHQLSKLEAIVKILLLEDVLPSKAFVEEFLNGRALKMNPLDTAVNGIISMNEHKKVHGIIIVSKTKDGLKNLENLINKAYECGNQDFLNNLSEEAEKHTFVITDFSLFDNVKMPHYHKRYNYIFLNPNDTSLQVFFHEMTHFLDRSKVLNEDDDNQMFSSNNETISNLLKKIEEKVNVTNRGVSLSYLYKRNPHKYSLDPVLNEKWLKDIKKKYFYLGKNEINELLIQKQYYEEYKYDQLSDFLIDIYDAIKRGMISVLNVGTGGHGPFYFADSKRVMSEFLANIGTIYNSDGADILNYELGEELTNELLQMYHDFLKENSENKKMA